MRGPCQSSPRRRGAYAGWWCGPSSSGTMAVQVIRAPCGRAHSLAWATRPVHALAERHRRSYGALRSTFRPSAPRRRSTGPLRGEGCGWLPSEEPDRRAIASGSLDPMLRSLGSSWPSSSSRHRLEGVNNSTRGESRGTSGRPLVKRSGCSAKPRSSASWLEAMAFSACPRKVVSGVRKASEEWRCSRLYLGKSTRKYARASAI